MLSALQMQWMPTLAVGVEAVLSLVKCSMTRPGSLCASIAKMALAAADGSCALG